MACTQAAGNFQVIGNLTVGGSVIDGNGILATNIVAPATPAAGTTRLYVDSTSKTLSAKNDAGTVSNTVVASTAVATQYMTGISAAGVITRAQPNFTDLAGQGSCAQEPALTGDVTTPAGSCATTFATVNANTGSWGTATQVPQFTVNGKGLITAAANVTVTPAVGSVTGLGAGVATALGVATNGNGGLPTYTTGSWTPTITTSGTVGTPAYSTQIGSYEQIGRQVTARFSIILSGWTGSPTGNVSITGLPVTNNGSEFGACHISNYTVSALAASSTGVNGFIGFTSTTIPIIQNTNTGTASLTAAQAGTTPTLIGFCNYHT